MLLLTYKILERRNKMLLRTNEKESISEVLEILSYMEEEYKNKIPTTFLRFLQDNKDINYKNHIDANVDIASQITKDKTKVILGIIFYNFWSNKEEKKEFEKILRENEIKKEEEADNLYKYEDLFKNKTNVINENNLPVEIKDKWYEKIANFLKKAFHIKK